MLILFISFFVLQLSFFFSDQSPVFVSFFLLHCCCYSVHSNVCGHCFLFFSLSFPSQIPHFSPLTDSAIFLPISFFSYLPFISSTSPRDFFSISLASLPQSPFFFSWFFFLAFISYPRQSQSRKPFYYTSRSRGGAIGDELFLTCSPSDLCLRVGFTSLSFLPCFPSTGTKCPFSHRRFPSPVFHASLFRISHFPTSPFSLSFPRSPSPSSFASLPFVFRSPSFSFFHFLTSFFFFFSTPLFFHFLNFAFVLVFSSSSTTTATSSSSLTLIWTFEH